MIIIINKFKITNDVGSRGGGGRGCKKSVRRAAVRGGGGVKNIKKFLKRCKIIFEQPPYCMQQIEN